MSWRDQMRVSVSKAEIELFKELQRRGLTRGMTTQVPFEFIWQVEGVHGTILDYYWHPPFNYAVFLDGEPVHMKLRRTIKDEKITEALMKRGVHVDRFRYKPPLSKRRLKEIADRIEETLEKLGYFTVFPMLPRL